MTNKQLLVALRNLTNKNNISTLLNDFGLVGMAAEVGVERGGYSEMIRKDWLGQCIYLIDCWENQEHSVYPDPCHAMDHGRNFEICKQTMAKFPANSYQIIKNFSLDAAKEFTDHFFDFVFIDGNHTYAAAMADIKVWYNKVKPGGILAGHDYVEPNLTYGVKPAVDEFVKLNNLELTIIPDVNNVPSWAIIR